VKKEKREREMMLEERRERENREREERSWRRTGWGPWRKRLDM
jgi:hypothetical protein